MSRYRTQKMIAALMIAFASATSLTANAADFVVYSVFRPLDMGDGVTPQKDYYVNMGSVNGLREGAVVDVYRKMPTFDLLTEKLYRDITFKIATLKVIHVEKDSAVARLDKMVAQDRSPQSGQSFVMVGDLIRPSER